MGDRRWETGEEDRRGEIGETGDRRDRREWRDWRDWRRDTGETGETGDGRLKILETGDGRQEKGERKQKKIGMRKDKVL